MGLKLRVSGIYGKTDIDSIRDKSLRRRLFPNLGSLQSHAPRQDIECLTFCKMIILGDKINH